MFNMSFQAAALVIMLLVLFHYLEQKPMYSINTLFFRGFVTLSILDVVFDILCTFMIMPDSKWPVEPAKFMLTVFYLLQIIVPYILVAYAQSLRNLPRGTRIRVLLFWMIPPAVMGILVLFNYRYGMMFYFTEEGIYQKGSWYLLMYIYAILMAVLVGLLSLFHYRELGFRNFKIIWEFLLLEAVCTGVQALNGELLMTSFGLGLGVLVLFLTINNPGGYTDSMTGLYDKQCFDSWIREALERQKPLHLIVVHSACLTRTNMAYGTSVGDQLLCQAARELKEFCGTRRIFRITGKRFLLAVDTLEEYERVRDRIQYYYSHPLVVNGEEMDFPAIICGIMNAEKMEREDTLLAYIDYMTSLAKDTDGTAVIQSDSKSLDGFRYEQTAESFLKTAIEQDLFEVYYQPVYSLKSDCYITLEALTRLRHPALGLIPPDVIFNIAERQGLISEIGLLQFKRICRFLRENPQVMQKIRNVKFNLSPSELLKFEYARTLISLIRENGLEPSWFQFEITETVATEYSEAVCRTVRLFQEAGIGLCLDDFGSGYANLNAVLRLPFSVVKMDRSLLTDICVDPQTAEFYRSIVTVMKNMGFMIISEGVEQKKEVDLLRAWGVDMIQGFYFSRPLPEKELLKELAKE